MTRCLTLAAALLAVAPFAEARDITGQMSYLERIALVDGAQLMVELRGPEGVVAEARIETGGRQVPLPFTLVAPDNGPYTLQGAIFVGGRSAWLSAAVAVPEGEGAVDLGVVPLARPVAMGFSSRMNCGGTAVEVGFADQTVRLRSGADAFDLTAVEAASGARFSDGGSPETVFWSKGNAAMVTLRGVDLPECLPVIVPALLPLTARGNEPGWQLELSDAGFVYEGNMGETRVEGPLPEAVAEGFAARFDVSGDFGLVVERAVCRDTMTGMPHPVSVTVTDKGQVLQGCGGAPADLLAGGWAVEHVEGAVLPEGAEVSIAFDTGAGRVFGNSGCNRFNGGFALSGEGLSFGAAAGTMMACPDDLMAVEQAFLMGLTTVDRFDLTANGALELYSGATVVVRARR